MANEAQPEPVKAEPTHGDNLYLLLDQGMVACWNTPTPTPEKVLERLFPNPRARELFSRHVMGEVTLPKKIGNQLAKLQETYATIWHEDSADKAFDVLLGNLKRIAK